MSPAVAGTHSHRETAARKALMLAVSGGIGLIALAFRMLSERGLANDHYMHLAWSQQVLLGEVPGRDFVDPGMPLAYGLSALAQYLSPGPFSEQLLSSLLLAAAAAATCAVAARMTGSILLGLCAALFEMALQPRFYSTPKILVPAVALLLLWWYLAQPSRWRLGWLSAWTVAATLLRHDLGVYAGVATGVGLVVGAGPQWRHRLSAVAGFVVVGLLLSVPYLAFVQVTNGIGEHAREVTEFGKSDSHQMMLSLPEFPATLWTTVPSEWNPDDAATLLAYVARLSVPLLFVLLAVRWRSLVREQRGMVVALAVLSACYAVIIVRHPLISRVSDAAAVLALAGAWIVGQTGTMARGYASASSGLRRGRSAVLAVVLAVAVVLVAGGSVASVAVVEKVGERVAETRVGEGVSKMRELLRGIAREGTQRPWETFWPNGPLPVVVDYVKACTTPSDRLYVTWAASEYYFFTERGFASGHSQPLPPRAFTTDRDQEKMLARFTRHHVPVVLINETNRPEFSRTYPRLDQYLDRHYTPIGRYTIRKDSETIAIAVRTDARAERTYGPDSWPCGFNSR